jgi:hypothetical protein
MRLRLLVCTVPALLGPALAQQRVSETVYPADAPVAVGDAVWQACRVVDGITGKPIAGAELFLVEEHLTPIPGAFWHQRVATSDADGFVRVRSDDVGQEWHMLLLRAPGYGPSAVSGVVPSLVWPLSPGLDLPIALRDWQGLPVPNARLGLCLGCGHTPDIANATTDAAGNAVLKGVDPNTEIADIYPEGPELGVGEYGGVEWVPGEPPAVVQVARGFPVRGKVVDENGKPKAAVYVGAPQVHRGPWAKTNADGTFTLDGAGPNVDLTVLIGRQAVVFERPDGEQPFTLQLPKLPDPKEDGKESGTEEDDQRPPMPGRQRPRRPPQPIVVELPALADGPPCTVELQVVDPTGKPIEQMEISSFGPLPRHRRVEEDVREGSASFERLPGKYEIRSRTQGFEKVLGTIEVAAGKPCKAKLTAVPFAPLQVRAESFAELGSISLRTADESVEITSQFAADGTATIGVPNDAPFCFVVGNDTGVHVVRTTLAEAKQKQPFVLRGIAPTQVAAVITGPDGKPVAADVALLSRHECLGADGGFDPRHVDLQPCDDGKVKLASKHAGLAFFAIVPRDAKLLPAIVPVTLPPLGVGAQFDAGQLKVGAQSQVKVLGADGEPKAGATVELARVGWHDVRQRGPAFVVDDKGALLAPALQAGDAVVVPADDWDIEREPADGEELVVDLPFRTVLAGAAPWTIQVPKGELVVELKDKDGAPVTGRLFVGDRCVLVPGKVRLRQVPPGAHELAVTAIDRKTVLARVDVKADGPTTLAVELTER